MGTNSRSLWCLGLFMLVTAAGSTAHATIGIVPEIDGGSVSAGLALLTGAVMILRSRRRR